jgi:hypothetical protein
MHCIAAEPCKNANEEEVCTWKMRVLLSFLNEYHAKDVVNGDDCVTANMDNYDCILKEAISMAEG